MIALLVNDTRCLRHVGCQLVIENTLRECKHVGIEVTGTVPNLESETAVQRVENSPPVDLVLINGEGTMHGDRTRAMEIAEAAKRASELGKKVVLYNTIWQNNRQLNAYLRHFDLVFCRETLSHRALTEAGASATIVPDMSFASRLPPELGASGQHSPIVLDNAKHRITRRLAWLAVVRKYRFQPMDPWQAAYVNKRLFLRWCLRVRTGAAVRPPGDNFFEQIAASDFVISGRFHGTCLAFLLGKAVASVAPPTHKIGGLYRDIGLDPEVIADATTRCLWAHPQVIQRQLDHVREHMPLIDRYVREAPQRISSMFECIRGLAP